MPPLYRRSLVPSSWVVLYCGALRADRRFAALLAFLALCAVSPAAAEDEGEGEGEEPATVGGVSVETNDPFDLNDPKLDDDFIDKTFFWVYELANLIHVQTREHVLRRELLLAPGDPFDPALVEETERNIRAIDFIASAETEAGPAASGPSVRDVRVVTRDKWSLRLGGGVGFVGGVSQGSFSVGDTNLLGFGKSLTLTYVQRTDRQILRTSYEDPNILGSRVLLDATLAVSDLGTLGELEVERPFYSRLTPYQARAVGTYEESDVEYFEDGDEIASIHQDIRQLELEGGLGFGPYEAVRRVQLRVSLDDIVYDPPEGDDPFAVRQPRDRNTQTVAIAPSLDTFAAWEELERLDAYAIVEDVPIGIRAEVAAGVQRRADSLGVRAEAVASAFGLACFQPFEGHISAVLASWAARHDGDSPQAYFGSGFYHHYFTGFPWQTVTFNLSLEVATEHEDLEAQITLGEDSGLRGYDARRFEGTRRLRANLEDRIFTPLNIGPVHVGCVVFGDAGLVWDDDETPEVGDLKLSVGFGLRFFAPELIKATPIRVDVGVPLSSGGADEGFSVSLSSGQVFSLFSNEEALEARF